MSLNQVDNTVGDAARFGVNQKGLLAVELADREKLPPPMGFKAGKPCTRSDQSVDGTKITLNIVKLTANLCFDP